MSYTPLSRWLLLSVLAAVLTIALKFTAYLQTSSVGLLSDALESLINLIAAVTAYWSINYAARPADANHTYGHEKIEFFSAGLEGALIVVAGLGTVAFAVRRLIIPMELQDLAVGLGLSLLATAINGVVGFVLLIVGRKHRSIILEADGKHLLTDVWTTLAVILGLFLVWLTRLEWLDSVAAILVGLNITVMGGGLIRRSFDGLMDHAIDPAEQQKIRELLTTHIPPNTTFHALRTRRAGNKTVMDFHLLVPGVTSVRHAHELSEQLEMHLHREWPVMQVNIHIEPIEDEASWRDNALKGIEPPAPIRPEPRE